MQQQLLHLFSIQTGMNLHSHRVAYEDQFLHIIIIIHIQYMWKYVIQSNICTLGQLHLHVHVYTNLCTYTCTM